MDSARVTFKCSTHSHTCTVQHGHWWLRYQPERKRKYYNVKYDTTTESTWTLNISRRSQFDMLRCETISRCPKQSKHFSLGPFMCRRWCWLPAHCLLNWINYSNAIQCKQDANCSNCEAPHNTHTAHINKRFSFDCVVSIITIMENAVNWIFSDKNLRFFRHSSSFNQMGMEFRRCESEWKREREKERLRQAIRIESERDVGW